MDVHVKDSTFKDIGLLEDYESLIWTERYSAYGDFELYVPKSNGIRSLITSAKYLTIPTSDRTMFVETSEESHRFKVTGRTLESVLTRRVVETSGPTPPTSLTNFITSIINYNMGSLTAIEERKIPFFQMYPQVPDGFTDPTEYDVVKYGDNLYDAVKKLCDYANLGFKIINRPGSSWLDFFFTYGEDLGYKIGNNQVIFSEATGNIQNVVDLSSTVPYKNVAVVNLPPWDDTVGVGEIWRVHKTGTDVPTGLNRREVWTDASQLRQDETFDHWNKPDRAVAWGKHTVAAYPLVDSIDFEIAPENTNKYKIDYDLGDIVRVIKPSGISVPHRVTEYIQSVGPEGHTAYPTLVAI